MPIPLGVLAVAGAGGGGAAGNAYELIATEILSSSQASVTFSNLGDYSSIYEHLQLRYVAKSTRAGVAFSNGAMRINGDTGSNYNAHYLVGNGSAVSSGSVGSSTSMLIGNQPGGTFTTNAFAAGVFDLLDVYNTNKFTTVRCLSGHVGNDNAVSLQSGLWRNTASVTSITILNWDSANLAANSRFSLYGMRSS
jgi:hypothetical protein